MDPDTIHVLLVEDNDEHAEVLTRLLQRSDDPVFEVWRYQALKPALERAGMPGVHLILLDLTLPDSDGLATFVRMQTKAPTVPIVVLSGVDDEALAVQTVQQGAQDYLVKGHVEDYILVRSLRYALERKRAQLDLKHAHDELERRVVERTAELVAANERMQGEVRERKHAEEALLESNRQLAEAMEQLRQSQEHVIQRERLHALGRMASGIAHDFNNALAPILGFSELLLLRPETLADLAKARGYVEMIHTAAEDSARIVARLREFYRYREESDHFTPVSLNDLIQQVISLTQPRWKDQAQAHGVNLTMRTELQNIPTVAGNEAELREMLFNVVFNAIDAIPKSGTITFRTFLRPEKAILQVTDTGVGMSEEVRSRCLEPFFSTKDEHGTGLGLGIVYGIVRRHDGTVEIESAPGQGTTVTICLPLYKEDRLAVAPALPAGMVQPLRILVVEDEPLVREVISVYLREDQHWVVTASNGREGLEKYREDEFDLVMTDRAMPEMNGDMLAAEIKKLNPQQPVILLTGFGDLMTGAGERPEGVDLVVSKPFTLNSLREAMEKTVRGRPRAQPRAAAGENRG